MIHKEHFCDRYTDIEFLKEKCDFTISFASKFGENHGNSKSKKMKYSISTCRLCSEERNVNDFAT